MENLRYALEHRPDIHAARLSLQSAGINVAYQKNQLLPKLDLSANLGITGVGDKSPRGWESLRDGEFPSWQVKLSLEIPLGNRGAKSKYAKSLLEQKKALAQYKSLENLVIVELRSAIRELYTAMYRVETAKKTRELAEKQLANEENKFRAGIITLFQVQDTEEKLTEARIVESNALLDYQRALVKLDKAKGSLLQNLGRFQIQWNLEKR
jgi:outer membrane protein TolC